MQLTPGKLMGLRRMADGGGVFKMLAADQRPPITGPIAAHHNLPEAPWEEVARFKAEITRRLQSAASAVLLDPHYGIPAAFDILDGDKGCVITLEDSAFRETGEGRFSANIDDWSVAKIKRMGGDAVKVLAWYRPDAAAATLAFQQDYVKRIGAECMQYDIPFLLELLVYPLAHEAGNGGGYIEMAGKRSDHVLQSVSEFAKADYGVDVFKLESPVNAGDADGSAAVQSLFDEMGAMCGRPWVMLSAGAGKDSFRQILMHACKAGASGFLAGRAIWQDAFAAYPDWEKITRGLDGGSMAYLAEISALAEKHARPWCDHACFGPGKARFAPPDATFRHGYESF